MATYYVYITEQCREDARKHGVTADIEKLAEKFEREQSDRGLDYYPPPYRKKVMGRTGRLIIEEYGVDDDIVLCFIRYLVRGSTEYESRFLDKTKEFYNRHKIEKKEIEEFLVGRKRKPVKKKVALSRTESAYLQPYTAPNYTDYDTFLESYDWVERISRDWAKDYLPRYYDMIFDIESGGLPADSDHITNPRNSNIRILFRNFPELKCTFLIAPIDSKNKDDEKELRGRYSHILNADTIEFDELIRHSLRAYPAILLSEEDIWMKVEKSEANLALSPEEESILESVMNPSSEGPRYPLFINGRPGSGKSTILQYLFSDHLARFIELRNDAEVDNHPLYLTYSMPLLDQARSSVKNMLTCGARNIENSSFTLEDDDLESILRICFRNFREFLRSLLPQNVKGKFSHVT